MRYNPNISTSALTKKTSALFVRLSNQWLKKRGITHAYTPFLVQLWDKNEQTQAELCRKIGIEQPAAVRTLDRMERDNLITRVRSTTDRRAIKIFLTPKAQQLQNDVIACALKINKIGTEGFTKNEQETLHLLLKKVIANLENAMN
ncbi:MAG TPA: MarR family transcriptional regulator [Gammaproteobacteria bacterium]|nr:MarR family transcriptional regulator [Gammaproteobacteria bacterium]